MEYVAHISSKKNPSILIHAAASGVGTSAIQLSKHVCTYLISHIFYLVYCIKLGVSPIVVTAGSQEKLDYCKQLGATHAINYKEGPFSPKVLEATDKKGINFNLCRMSLLILVYRSIRIDGFYWCILLERKYGTSENCIYFMLIRYFRKVLPQKV